MIVTDRLSENDWGLISGEEWKALEIKHQYAKTMFSVILEGLAVVFVTNKKKRANRSGSRGKYISNAILYYEKHSQSKSIIKSAEDEVFRLQLRVFHLERTLRENGIEVPPETI